MKSILLKPCSMNLKAKLGRQVGPRVSGRWSDRAVDFPEINLTEVPGPVKYSPAWGHALVSESNMLLEHSLIVSLHPKRRPSVEQQWIEAIKKAPKLKERKLNSSVYFASNEGAGTWGHWVVHNLPRILLLHAAHPDCLIVVPDDYRYSRYNACLDLLKVFGIKDESLIFVRRDELIVADQAFLVDLPYCNEVAHPVVFEYFRNSFGSLTKKHHKNQVSPLTFINRSVKKREISNWSEVENFLLCREFKIAETSGPLRDQVLAWSQSGAVSGILGSDLTNMLLGNLEQLFVVSPEWFGDHFFFGLAAGMDLEWNELVCDHNSIAEIRNPKSSSSFCLSVDGLQKFFDGI